MPAYCVTSHASVPGFPLLCSVQEKHLRDPREASELRAVTLGEPCSKKPRLTSKPHMHRRILLDVMEVRSEQYCMCSVARMQTYALASAQPLARLVAAMSSILIPRSLYMLSFGYGGSLVRIMTIVCVNCRLPSSCTYASIRH